MKVWLIYSGECLRHICSTEALARKRFGEVKKALLLHQKETLFPKDLDHTLDEDDISWAKKQYKYHEDKLNSLTFEINELENYIYHIPRWEVWEVE